MEMKVPKKVTNSIKSLDITVLKDKKMRIISSVDALKDVEPYYNEEEVGVINHMPKGMGL